MKNYKQYNKEKELFNKPIEYKDINIDVELKNKYNRLFFNQLLMIDVIKESLNENNIDKESLILKIIFLKGKTSQKNSLTLYINQNILNI